MKTRVKQLFMNSGLEDAESKLLKNFCLSPKWNDKEWKSKQRLLPVVCVAWTLSSKRCRFLVSFEYLFHRRFHIYQECFSLTIANKNLKNEFLRANNHECLSKSSFIIAHITQTSQTNVCNTSTRENSAWHWKVPEKLSWKLSCDEIIYEQRWQLCFAVNFN